MFFTLKTRGCEGEAGVQALSRLNYIIITEKDFEKARKASGLSQNSFLVLPTGDHACVFVGVLCS